MTNKITRELKNESDKGGNAQHRQQFLFERDHWAKSEVPRASKLGVLFKHQKVRKGPKRCGLLTLQHLWI